MDENSALMIELWTHIHRYFLI